MMTYYIYILYAAGFDKFYIGQSSDVASRLYHHNTDDKNTFTSKYRPWELKAVFEVVESRGD